jgi:hypothetical protein
MLNNPCLYDAVICNVANSNNSFIVDPTSADYLAQANAAVALATEIDSVIAPIDSGPNGSQIMLIGSIVRAVMSGRTITSINPSEYSSIANGVAALFAEMNTKLNGTPNILASAHVHDDGLGPVIQRSYNVADVVVDTSVFPAGVYQIIFDYSIDLEHTHFTGTYHAAPPPAPVNAGVCFVLGGTGTGTGVLKFARYNVFSNQIEAGDFSFDIEAIR